MPSFNCDGCGDVIKKPKLDFHSQRCRAPFTCLDCSTTFPNPHAWSGHTSCISEAQKYEKSVYKPPKPKGANKRQLEATVARTFPLLHSILISTSLSYFLHSRDTGSPAPTSTVEPTTPAEPTKEPKKKKVKKNPVVAAEAEAEKSPVFFVDTVPTALEVVETAPAEGKKKKMKKNALSAPEVEVEPELVPIPVFVVEEEGGDVVMNEVVVVEEEKVEKRGKEEKKKRKEEKKKAKLGEVVAEEKVAIVVNASSGTPSEPEAEKKPDDAAPSEDPKEEAPETHKDRLKAKKQLKKQLKKEKKEESERKRALEKKESREVKYKKAKEQRELKKGRHANAHANPSPSANKTTTSTSTTTTTTTPTPAANISPLQPLSPSQLSQTIREIVETASPYPLTLKEVVDALTGYLNAEAKKGKSTDQAVKREDVEKKVVEGVMGFRWAEGEVVVNWA